MPLDNGAALSAQLRETDMDRREFIDSVTRVAAVSAVTGPALAATEEKGPTVAPAVSTELGQ